MRVAITGATGLVGRSLAARLVELGHQVIAWSRNPDAARRKLPARCEVRAWEPNGAVAAAEVAGLDAIVHLAGEPIASARWSEARRRRIRDSRIESARRIVDAIAALPASERPSTLISASAIGIYGDRGDEILDEAAAPGSGFLAEVCRDWEAAVARARESGVRCVSLRFGIVLAKEGGALAAMLTPFRLGAGGRIGSGGQWMSWIHRDDLVEMLRFALEDERVSGVLNGVAPEPVTNRSFTEALAGAVGRPALLPVPAAALRLALGDMATILLASQRVRPAAAESLGFRFAHTDLRAALADILRDPARELVREQIVPAPVERVFPFFADARNLERITPDFLHFRVLDVRPRAMGEGTRIDYRLRLHGIPLRWRSVIEAWDPDRRFVDAQERGPYALWQHTHEFEPVPGGTLVRDRVRYRLPLGVLGDLVAGWLVERDLERVFDFRSERIGALVAGDAGRPG
jgi:uncharacterized protein